MKDNTTPEERLLKLIRKGGKLYPPRGIAREDPVKRGLPAPNFSVIQLAKRTLPFLNIKRAVLAVFILSCVYLVISLVYPFFSLKTIKLPETKAEKALPAEAEKQKPEIRPLESYTQGIENRRIFGSAQGDYSQKTGDKINPDLIKDINLIGIISGDNPQAIIENKAAQKTYYVNKGQFIGEFLVEDIKEGKVILNYNGRRFELYL
ncbi:MAG: type II secretion system protein N [Candidatus Omnitrophica bacterium]|nr:type II secretion system protein N [Candidatus Omnitrophota bacterium]